MFYHYMEVEGKMKRIFSVLLALVLMVSTATVAFAKGGEKQKSGKFSGIADFGDPYVSPGDLVYLDIDYFYGSWKEKETEWDNKKDKEVTVTYEYDNEDEPIGYLDKEYHTVSATWTSGGQYVQGVYFEDGDSDVIIEIKGGITSSVDKEIKGTIQIREKGIPNRPTVTYKCKIGSDTLIVRGVDEKAEMEEIGNKLFGLPDEYQSRQVKFVTEDGEKYGTFLGEFSSPTTGQDLAEFRVRISSQSSLYLGFSESADRTLKSKYPNAEMRFINWTGKPSFVSEGKLSIYMEPEEYIYGLNSDGSLYRLGGTYDSDNGAYVITTRTLGSYVISDTQLTAGGSGTAGGTTAASSSSAAPASSAAPSAAAPASTAPASSAAPAAPAPSESSEEEQPSEPESSEPEEISSAAPAITQPDDSDDKGDKKPAEKSGFPIVPVLLGVLGVVIVVCGVVVVGSRSNKGSHARRRRYDDDWDD